MTKWHKGPPPEIGWWPASVYEEDECIRWWDGNSWSMMVIPSYSAKLAGESAEIKSADANSGILWSERWWLK